MMYKKVTGHTDQSMKSRFKVILNSLGNYDIPDDLRRKFRGEKPDTSSRPSNHRTNRDSKADTNFLFKGYRKEEKCCSNSKGGISLLSSDDVYSFPTSTVESVSSVNEPSETNKDVNVRSKTHNSAEGQKFLQTKKSSTQTLSESERSKKQTLLTETTLSQTDQHECTETSAESNNQSKRQTRRTRRR